MSYVCYYQCDDCGKRADADLTPPGWTFPGDSDYCRDCSAKREAAQRQSKERP